MKVSREALLTNSFTFTPSRLGQGSDAMPGYDGETFTGEFGHFIGQDGFIVPADFSEFYERYPVYVRNWTSKRLKKVSTHPDVEDWTQTLLAHLCQLPPPKEVTDPKTGKKRMTGGKLYKLGFKDVIHAYNPWAHYGASARRFFNFLNLCLSNKYSSLRSRYGKDATQHVSFSLDDHVPGEDGPIPREYLLMDRSTLYQEAVKETPTDHDTVFVQQFRDYVERRDPTLAPLAKALMTQDRIEDVLKHLGIDQNQFLRDRKKLVRLSRSFQLGRK